MPDIDIRPRPTAETSRGERPSLRFSMGTFQTCETRTDPNYFRLQKANLFRFHTGGLEDRAELARVRADELGHLLRGAVGRIHAERGIALLHLGQCNDALELPV